MIPCTSLWLNMKRRQRGDLTVSSIAGKARNGYFVGMKLLLFLVFMPAIVFAQPKDAKTIIVKNVTFTEVCSQLLDKGYAIEKKDDQLQTVRTEPKKYTTWNAAYVINIRVKDSTAFITATFTAPYENPLTSNAAKQEPLWNNEPVYNRTNKKGVPQSKSMQGYAFKAVNEFALSFNKPVEYSL